VALDKKPLQRILKRRLLNFLVITTLRETDPSLFLAVPYLEKNTLMGRTRAIISLAVMSGRKWVFVLSVGGLAHLCIPTNGGCTSLVASSVG